MYSACIFCHSDLGSNEAIEHFPVGRRLAFDSAKGRLWVVCRRCQRWNLTPLEERWEAIEECERQFSSTRLRVSTDNIGLARVREGLELVRIGVPMRPEFAAWRYGDQFGRRRRKTELEYVALGALAIGWLVASPWTAMAFGSVFQVINFANSMSHVYRNHRVRVRIPRPDGGSVPIRRIDSKRIVLGPTADGFAVHLLDKKRTDQALVSLEGDRALRAMSSILPVMNWGGADKKTIGSAVQLVEEHPRVDTLVRSTSRSKWWIDPVENRWVMRERADGKSSGVPLSNISSEMRLALEIAAHEDVERRALEGELALLEQAWRDAEEVGRIADDLLVPESTRRDHEKLVAGSSRSDRS